MSCSHCGVTKLPAQAASSFFASVVSVTAYRLRRPSLSDHADQREMKNTCKRRAKNGRGWNEKVGTDGLTKRLVGALINQCQRLAREQWVTTFDRRMAPPSPATRTELCNDRQNSIKATICIHHITDKPCGLVLHLHNDYGGCRCY